MAQRFEEFSKVYGQGGRRTIPPNQLYIRVCKGGHTANMSDFTFKQLGSPKAVLLMFDKKTNTIGLKPCEPDATNAFVMYKASSGSTMLVSTSAFCKHYGIDTTKSYGVTPTIENGVLVVGLNPPKASKKMKHY